MNHACKILLILIILHLKNLTFTHSTEFLCYAYNYHLNYLGEKFSLQKSEPKVKNNKTFSAPLMSGECLCESGESTLGKFKTTTDPVFLSDHTLWGSSDKMKERRILDN